MMKEKATIPKRVRGTVLLTVVAVMMVLIVFLAATLALATTANRRAYTNYQQEQAEYTARAVLDSVMEQVRTEGSTPSTNPSYAGGICGYIVNVAPGTSEEFEVTISDGTNSEVHNVTVTNMDDTRSIYDDTEGKFIPLDVYQLAVTVESQTTNASATYESYIGLNREWIADPGSVPPVSPSSSNGGAFVSLGDTGGTEISTHGFTTGGTYIGIGIPDTGTPYKLGSNEMTVDAPLYINGSLNANNKLYIHFTKPDDFMVVKGDLTLGNDMFIRFDGYSDTGANYENTPYIYIDGRFDTGVKQNFADPDNKFDNPDNRTRESALNIYCGTFYHNGNGFKMSGDLYMMDEDGVSTIGTSAAQTKLFNWTKDTFTRAEGYDTQYGNIYSMGSLNVTGGNGIYVEGNVQINGDLTVEKLEVNGDVVVNGTLKVTNSLKANNVIANTIQGTNITANSIKAVNASVAHEEIDVSSLTAKDAHTYETWYEVISYDKSDAAQWGWNNIWFYARYKQHQTIDGVEQPVVTIPNDWEYEHIIEYQGGGNTEGYPDIDEYAKAKSPKAKAMLEGTVLTETVSGYDLSNSSVWPYDVYPQDYTRASLLTNKIEDPTAIDYESMYPTQPSDLDPTIFDGGQYQITRYKPSWESMGAEYPSSKPDGNNDALLDTSGGYYRITTDCVLTGNWDKNIFIDGSTGARTVVLDNFSLNNAKSGIIIDDANQVTLVIVGNVTLGNNSCIITTDYLNMLCSSWSFSDDYLSGKLTQNITIPQVAANLTDPTYPNVLIYSIPPNTGDDTMSKLDINIDSIVTALVRAPKMRYVSHSGTRNVGTMTYQLPTGGTVDYGVGASISGDNNKAIGLIGQLIAGKIELGADGTWGMLYVTTASGGTPPTPPPTTPPATPSGSGYWVTTFRPMYTNTY